MKKQVKDFGQKILGAKKDIVGSLKVDDLGSMDLVELAKVADKKQLWPKPTDLFDDEYSNYLANKFYGCFRNRPSIEYSDEEDLQKYIMIIKVAKGSLEELAKRKECDHQSISILAQLLFERDSGKIAMFRRPNTQSWSYIAMERSKVSKKSERKLANKSPRIKLEYLNDCERRGYDYRLGSDITGEDLLNSFSLIGGQFGNYESNKERQKNLNCSYDSFTDLALLLDIDMYDISLGGKLGIAFGARGQGKAKAHYETLHTVINLTKKKGAGSLAHEWSHALDHYLSRLNDCPLSLYTKAYTHSVKIEAMDEIIDFLKSYTDYRKDSIRIDSYENRHEAYWTTTPELFARAFEAYISDKLDENGLKNDYLVHEFDITGFLNASMYPQGEDRKKLNNLFDRLFLELKEKGIFKPFNKRVKEVATRQIIDSRKLV